jgi:phi13 family phage major tail protein|nr:MAG TPA_asm: tail tube protein [Caudoviricetes sp.]
MKKSIVKVGYAPINWSAEESKYTYGAIKWFESEKSGGREFEATPRGEPYEVYADGKLVMAGSENDGYDITLQLLDLVDDVDKDWFGNAVDSDKKGVAEYSEGKEFPKFALIIVYTQTDGTYLTEYYYQVQAAERPKISGKTSEGKFEAAFLDTTLKALPREHDEPAKRLVRYSHKTSDMPTVVVDPTAAV